MASGPGDSVTGSSDEATNRIFRSLADALAAHRIPDENHALIRRLCEHVGIERFEDRTGYIKAVRGDGGPALQINYGWTNGFRSEIEVRTAVGDDASYWESGRGTELWGVTHPVNNIGHGGGGPAKDVADHGTCPNCFLELPATGICDNCS